MGVGGARQPEHAGAPGSRLVVVVLFPSEWVGNLVI